MTLEAVAAEVGVSTNALSLLERGKVGYTQGMLESLASVYECEPVDLIGRDPKDSESLWLLWKDLSLAVRHQIIEVAKTLARTQT